mmetsp:Transcript_10687/g.20128  ORF Transcript_10687/g.20128 Transcript_10687/m.20128 type:complete len:89 (+) Transcript_10687:3-269(+)
MLRQIRTPPCERGTLSGGHSAFRPPSVLPACFVPAVFGWAIKRVILSTPSVTSCPCGPYDPPPPLHGAPGHVCMAAPMSPDVHVEVTT